MSSELTVDLVSDVVCPWCFIGKRQLDAAFAQRGVPSPLVRWHAFQLNPDMPAGGMPREDYLRAKFGRADGAGIYDRVRAAAATAGLTLNLESIRRQPNTLKAHALIATAGVAPLASAVAEALFTAYFQAGEDLTDDATLRRVASGAGLDEASIDAALGEEAMLREQIAEGDRNLRAQGIGGVPLFVFSAGDRQAAVSGAQGPAALLAAIENVLA